MKTFKVADLFCGAGGSSLGAKRALERAGIKMDLLCVNHWPIAIETHKRNHPEARHYCQDLATLRPGAAVPGGVLDLLMASPTCTYHSRARGAKPISDQQRMDPWHIVTWLTEIRVTRMLVENVPEFVEWGPVNARTGRPLKSRKGEYFRVWCSAIRALGFELEHRILNAADYGDATTRKRFFMQARSDGQPIKWPEATHAPRGLDLLGKETWRPAREIIDWSLEGRSIFGRKKPLARNTLKRILAGCLKLKWPEPFILALRQHMDGRSLEDPLPTICAGGTHFGLVQPFTFANRTNNQARGVEDTPATICTAGNLALVEPFILSQASGGAPKSVEEPVQTFVADGAHALIAPYYSSGSGKTCSSVDDPLPTVTSKARFAMVMPVTHQDLSNRARDVSEPLPTLTTANRGELAFITAQFGERKGQVPRIHTIDRPAPTVTASGHIDLVQPGRDFDILFRMLQPHELAAAMGFDAGETDYEFVGNKTQVNKQIGNAVPVNTAVALVAGMV